MSGGGYTCPQHFVISNHTTIHSLCWCNASDIFTRSGRSGPAILAGALRMVAKLCEIIASAPVDRIPVARPGRHHFPQPPLAATASAPQATRSRRPGDAGRPSSINTACVGRRILAAPLSVYLSLSQTYPTLFASSPELGVNCERRYSNNTPQILSIACLTLQAGNITIARRSRRNDQHVVRDHFMVVPPPPLTSSVESPSEGHLSPAKEFLIIIISSEICLSVQ